MNRTAPFAAGVGLGAALALLVGSLGPIVGGLFIVLLVPLGVRGGLPATSGVLIGFGGLWTALTLSQLGRDGATGTDGLWLAVGLVPLVLGAAGLAIVVARNRPQPNGPEAEAVP